LIVMAETLTHIHERAEDESAREYFAKYGHVALANVYDASLGESAILAATKGMRLHTNGRLSGQTGDVRYSHLASDNPLKQVITSTLRILDQLVGQFDLASSERPRGQIIDQRAGAEGIWHRDNGVAITTLLGGSWFEIKGEDGSPDAAYELKSGR